jgi:hypothetical protein
MAPIFRVSVLWRVLVVTCVCAVCIVACRDASTPPSSSGSMSLTPTPTPTPVPAPDPSACAESNGTGDPNVSTRCVQFAGYEWRVKSSASFGPGPNAWSDDPGNVWVDADGLHLKITNRNGRWYASEVILNRPSLGYGTYTFRTRGNIDALDDRIVLGLFTYDYLDPAFSHREIDIEFSKSLGVPPRQVGHFTVQPYTSPTNTYDFPSRLTGPIDTHVFEWRQDRITFSSGTEHWTFAGSGLPSPGAEHVRANVWLFDGAPPLNGAEAEVTITDFHYDP